jgi:hypothetical protein
MIEAKSLPLGPLPNFTPFSFDQPKHVTTSSVFSCDSTFGTPISGENCPQRGSELHELHEKVRAESYVKESQHPIIYFSQEINWRFKHCVMKLVLVINNEPFLFAPTCTCQYICGMTIFRFLQSTVAIYSCRHIQVTHQLSPSHFNVDKSR